MNTIGIILIVISAIFFFALLSTKSKKTRYHHTIRGPNVRIPGRDDAFPPKKPEKPAAPPKI